MSAGQCWFALKCARSDHGPHLTLATHQDFRSDLRSHQLLLVEVECQSLPCDGSQTAHADPVTPLQRCPRHGDLSAGRGLGTHPT